MSLRAVTGQVAAEPMPSAPASADAVLHAKNLEYELQAVRREWRSAGKALAAARSEADRRVAEARDDAERQIAEARALRSAAVAELEKAKAQIEALEARCSASSDERASLIADRERLSETVIDLRAAYGDRSRRAAELEEAGAEDRRRAEEALAELQRAREAHASVLADYGRLAADWAASARRESMEFARAIDDAQSSKVWSLKAFVRRVLGRATVAARAR